jgi:hypothetical protein
MRQRVTKTLIAVLAVMMVVPLAVVADEGTRAVDEPPAIVAVRIDSRLAPHSDSAPALVIDRPIAHVRDLPADRVTDRIRDRRHRDRPTDHPNFQRRLVTAGCIVELPNGEWEWTGACGPDDLPPSIQRLIHRLLYSHLWRQLYRLLHWLTG